MSALVTRLNASSTSKWLGTFPLFDSASDRQLAGESTRARGGNSFNAFLFRFFFSLLLVYRRIPTRNRGPQRKPAASFFSADAGGQVAARPLRSLNGVRAGKKKKYQQKNGGSNKELERESRSSHLPRDSHRDHLLHHLPLSFTFISSLLRFYSLLPSRLFFSLSLSRPIISILIFAEWARSFAIVFFLFSLIKRANKTIETRVINQLIWYHFDSVLFVSSVGHIQFTNRFQDTKLGKTQRDSIS